MSGETRRGLLLLNLGTPKSPSVPHVRAFLREFLSDPRVIDLPAWRRFLLLHLVILRFRPRRSSAAYRSIWTPRGSPLLVAGEQLAERVQHALGAGVAVELAMRYGEPGIAGAFERFRRLRVARIAVCPLFATGSAAATGSALAAVFAEAGRGFDVPALSVVPPYFAHPAYLEAKAALARPVLERLRPDHVLFSFHGLPERQLRKSAAAADPSAAPGCGNAGCCDHFGAGNELCYRAQCFASARLLAGVLGLAPGTTTVAFQSRLGRGAWTTPATEVVLEQLGRSGCSRLLVIPGFVADCLETQEELGLRGSASFRASGGGQLELVPALNADPVWVASLLRIARDTAPWLEEHSLEQHSLEEHGLEEHRLEGDGGSPAERP